LQDDVDWGTAVGWLFAHALGRVADEQDAAGQSRAWLDEWLLGASIGRALQDLGADEGRAARGVAVVKIATEHQNWLGNATTLPQKTLTIMLGDEDVRRYIGVNRYQGVLYFSKERFEELLWWLMLAATVKTSDGGEQLAQGREVLARLTQAAAASGYQLEKLLALASGPEPASKTASI
jgi:hypothetical protein